MLLLSSLYWQTCHLNRRRLFYIQAEERDKNQPVIQHISRILQQFPKTWYTVYTYSQLILVGVKDFIQVTVGHR